MVVPRCSASMLSLKLDSKNRTFQWKMCQSFLTLTPQSLHLFIQMSTACWDDAEWTHQLWTVQQYPPPPRSLGVINVGWKSYQNVCANFGAVRIFAERDASGNFRGNRPLPGTPRKWPAQSENMHQLAAQRCKWVTEEERDDEWVNPYTDPLCADGV